MSVGRFTPSQSERFGRILGSVGYISFGPIALLFNLPRALQVTDPGPSIVDLNSYLREAYRAQGKAAPAWIPAPGD